MTAEKLPQNENFDDLLPEVSQQPEADLDSRFDALEEKVAAAERRHQNEVEAADRRAHLESARARVSEMAASGAAPSEMMSTATKLTAGIPKENKYGIVAMGDATKGTKEAAKAGDNDGDTKELPVVAPAQTQPRRSVTERLGLDKQSRQEKREARERLSSFKLVEDLANPKEGQQALRKPVAEDDPTAVDPGRQAAPLSRSERALRARNTRAAAQGDSAAQSGGRVKRAVQKLWYGEGASTTDETPGTTETSEAKNEERAEKSADTPEEVKSETAAKSAEEPKAKKTTVSVIPGPRTAATATAPAARTTPVVRIVSGNSEASSSAAVIPALPEGITAMTDQEATADAYARMGQPARVAGQPLSNGTVAFLNSPKAKEYDMGTPVLRPGTTEAEPAETGTSGTDSEAETTQIPTVTPANVVDLLTSGAAAPTAEEQSAEPAASTAPEASTTENEPATQEEEGGNLNAILNAQTAEAAAAEEQGEQAEEQPRQGRLRRLLGRLAHGNFRNETAEERVNRMEYEDRQRAIRRERQLRRDSDRASGRANRTQTTAEVNPDENESSTGVINVSERNRREEGRVSRRTKFIAGAALMGVLAAGTGFGAAEMNDGPAKGHAATAERGHDAKDKKDSDTHKGGGKTGSNEGGSSANNDGGSSDRGNRFEHSLDTIQFSQSGNHVTATLKDGGNPYQAAMDANLSPAQAMQAFENGHITNETARHLPVGAHIEFQRSGSGEWTAKIGQ